MEEAVFLKGFNFVTEVGHKYQKYGRMSSIGWDNIDLKLPNIINYV